MKNARKTIFIIHFLLLLAMAFATPSILNAQSIHYVTQNGSGIRNGESLSNSWSVSDFNSLNGTKYAGGTFYFSGLITSTINVNISGTSGNYVTIDGYQKDDTTYMNVSESSGRARIDTNSDGHGIDIDGENYIIVQDFEITDTTQGIFVDNTDHIIIKRCYIFESFNGIYFGHGNNYTAGGSSGHGNVVKNVGIRTSDEDIALSSVTDVILSYNHLYADDTSWGIDGIMAVTYADNVLVEYNSIHDHDHSTGDKGENAIDIKGTSDHWIIRYNRIYGHDYQSEIILNGSTGASVDQVYIYGNRIGPGPQIGIEAQAQNGESYDDVYIFSNIIYKMTERGVSFDESSTAAYIFNNTFAENGSTSNQTYTHVYSHRDATMALKNNIYYKGRPSQTDYVQLNLNRDADNTTTSDYNRYYWPSQMSILDWGDAGQLNLSQVKNYDPPSQGPNGSEGDPGLTDIDNNDYTIASGAAIIDAGVDIGSGDIATVTIQGVAYPVYWDVALGPNTNWSETIPVIEVLHRDHVGWDIGAYSYEEKRIMKLMPPSKLQIKVVNP
jgi:hypothetical protein